MPVDDPSGAEPAGVGPLSSNFIEGVWQPGFSPIYWPEQDGPYGIWKGESSKSGRAVTCQPAASHGPSARFDVQYVNSFRPRSIAS